MKKFLAISASAVLAFSVLAFTACDEKTEKGVEDLTYTEVDLSTEEAKSEFLKEVESKINFETIFGDTQAEGFNFGFAADLKLNAEINATAKAVDLGNGAKDLTGSAKVELGESVKYKSSGDSGLMASQTTVKYNTNLPEDVYTILGEVGLPEATIELLKAVLPSGNYTVKEYMDDEYAYIEYPESIADLLPEDYAGVLPEGGKLKMPLGGYDSDDKYYTPYYSVAPYDEDLPYESQTVLGIGQMLEMLYAYDVKVAVSNENGYAIKLTADEGTIIGIISEATGDAQIAAMVEQVATFNTCAITLYLAVDNDGVFKEASVKVNLDATVSMAANLIMEGIPEIVGSVKLNLDFGVKKYDGQVNLPADLDNYVDVTKIGDGNAPNKS